MSSISEQVSYISDQFEGLAFKILRLLTLYVVAVKLLPISGEEIETIDELDLDSIVGWCKHVCLYLRPPLSNSFLFIFYPDIKFKIRCKGENSRSYQYVYSFIWF